MESFVSYVRHFPVEENGLGVFWFGQAGFIFKDSKGKTLAVDPYFSDCCLRYVGFRRMIPFLMSPCDMTLDAIVCSHAHYDHFDPDGLPLAMQNGQTKLYAAYDCKPECERLHLLDRVNYVKVGDQFQAAGFAVRAVACDHGEQTKDAVGLLIEHSGKRVYLMGDTCLRKDLLSDGLFENLDLLILPINGAFGNLNEQEAAEVCSILKPKLAIPCHFGNFAEHGGNPGLFAELMQNQGKDVNYRIMRVGEGIAL